MTLKSFSAPLARVLAPLVLLGVGVAVPGSAVAAETASDTSGPTVTVKDGDRYTVGADGRYRLVSFKLHDAGKVDRVTINGTERDLPNPEWSDLNFLKPGTSGAREGKNTLVAYDVAGNATTVDFVLDTTGPEVTVKETSVGHDPVFSTVSFKLHDGSKVTGLDLNGTTKTVTANAWSDLNGVTSGAFGAVEGENTLTVHDALGNTTTVDFVLDTVAPDVTVKKESQESAGRYAKVSFALHDARKIDRVTINGTEKDLTDNMWSDVNDVKPGTFGAHEGANTLVAYDVAGNATTVPFVLDTTGPEVTVKDESRGTDPSFRAVSFTLHDGASVDHVVLNGQKKDLNDNEWSDVNGVVPGVFGAVEGANTLVAFDVLGNATTVEFSLDTNRPVVEIATPTAGQITSGAKAGDVTLTATDDHGLRRVAANLYQNGELVRPVGSTSDTSALGGTSWTGSWAIPTDLADGDYTVRTGVTDLAGNWGGAETELTIDSTDPAIAVPEGEQTVGAEERTFDLSQVEAHPDWTYVEIDQIGTDGKWQKVSGQRFEDVNEFSFTVDGADLTEGVRSQVKITSVDLAGNRTSRTFPVAVDFGTEDETSGGGSGEDNSDQGVAPTLDGSTVSTETVGGLPWIDFDVTLNDPDHTSTGDVVYLELTDGTHTKTITLGELVDGHLAGKTLWPGASEAADGTPAAWPGWAQDSHGAWVRTDEGYAWTLGEISAKLVVNPELAVDLAYPAGAGPQLAGEAGETPSDTADADAVTGSDDAGSGDAGSDDAGTDVVVTGAQTVSDDVAVAPADGAGATGADLPQTGFDVALFAGAAALLMLLGGGLVIARRRA